MNIKALVYARYSTSVKIHSVVKEDSNRSITADIEKLPLKIKALRARTNERDKLKTQYGVWFVTHDENDISYAVCTDEEYPQRHAYGMIDQLKEKIGQINHVEYQTEQNIKAQTKKLANELCVKYNDLKKVDKLAVASSEVDDLKDEIGTGIKKLMGNQESLEQMSEKAQKMKTYAHQFEKNSDKLERMLYWRNCKLKVLAVIFIVALIGFIILIIVKSTG